MATAHRVTCINKSDRKNPHERILNIGGAGWKLTEQEAIASIFNGTYTFYVDVRGLRVGVVVAKSRSGSHYLKTTNDGDQPNNLLSLPECP